MDGPAMGDRVREIVTGREGVLTGKTEYLWGCEQFLLYVDGERDKDGHPVTIWLDVNRLEIIERGAVAAFDYERSETRELAFTGPDTAPPVR